MGGLRRGSAGDAVLYTDDNTQAITIGGGSASTNTSLVAGTDIFLDGRGMSTPLQLNEAGFLDLPDNLSSLSLIRLIHQLNKRHIHIAVFSPATSVVVGDGQFYFTIPDIFDGMNLIRAQAKHITASGSGDTRVMVHNATTGQDMLTGNGIVIAGGATAGTPATIDTDNDDVSTDDDIRIDVDLVGSGPAPLGLNVILTFGI